MISKTAAVVSVALVAMGGWVAWGNRTVKADHPTPVSTESSAPAVVSTKATTFPVESAVSQAAVPKSTQPLRPATSFSGEKDIWGFAHKALARGRTEDLLEARIATTNCLTQQAIAPQLKAAAAGASSPAFHGAMTPGRQMAIADLQSRCAGFEKVGKDGALSFNRELVNRLEQAGYKIDPKKGPTSENLRFGLSAGAPDFMAASTEMLLGPLTKRMDIPDKDPREDLVAQALILAQCDLGIDCSAEGWRALQKCALVGECGGELNAGWEQEYDPQKVSQINAYRQEIVAAIKSHDWKALGLE
jgi:hypothetical protein